MRFQRISSTNQNWLLISWWRFIWVLCSCHDSYENAMWSYSDNDNYDIQRMNSSQVDRAFYYFMESVFPDYCMEFFTCNLSLSNHYVGNLPDLWTFPCSACRGCSLFLRARQLFKTIKKQTIKESNNQTDKQSNNQTIKPTSSQTIKQSNRRTIKHSNNQTIKPTSSQTIK